MPRPFFIRHHKKDEIIRVNHAGETGAKYIYLGQLSATKNQSEKALLQEMLDHETQHLDFFTEKMITHHVRPSLLLPLWNKIGYYAGKITARFGYKEAMLLTEAVEEVIEKHYQKQIDYLLDLNKYQPTSNTQDLLTNIQKFRLEEIEHQNIAIKHRNEYNRSNLALYYCIKICCKIAIQLSKKI